MQSTLTLCEEEQLVEQHLGLIRLRAERFASHPLRPPHLDADDFLSLGRVGALRGIRSYDPRCGRSLTNWIGLKATHAMVDELRRHCCRDAAKLLRQVEVVEEELAVELGRPPTEAELARASGLTEERLRWCREAVPSFVNLDAEPQVADEAEFGKVSSRHNLFASADPAPDEEAMRREAAEILSRQLRALPDSQRRVVMLVYLDGWKRIEVASLLGVSPPRITQILDSAFRALRQRLHAAGVEAGS